MASKNPEPLLDAAGGDPALSLHLRNSLRVLRARSDDREFRRLVDDVLAGRRSLRDAGRSPAFTRVLDTGVADFGRHYDQLSEDDRVGLAAEGRRQFSELRDRIAREEAAREG
jgi:hypothetical protein